MCLIRNETKHQPRNPTSGGRGAGVESSHITPQDKVLMRQGRCLVVQAASTATATGLMMTDWC